MKYRFIKYNPNKEELLHSIDIEYNHKGIEWLISSRRLSRAGPGILVRLVPGTLQCNILTNSHRSDKSLKALGSILNAASHVSSLVRLSSPTVRLVGGQ